MNKLLTLILIIICALTSTVAHAKYETGGVVKTILSNGVTVLVKPEPESKVAAIEIFVRVGAQNEDESNAGIGQLVAGSMLSGSTRRGTVKLARLVSEVGGNFHAVWQWNYIEVYAVTRPSACEEAISLLADAVQHSSFEPVAVDYSRSAILKEMNRRNDDAFNSAYTAIRGLLYTGTPYARSYLGNPDRVKSITLNQISDFYKKNFVSDRIIVAVAGNVDPEAVAHRVEVCFKSMDFGSGEPAKIASPTVTKRAVNVNANSRSTYVMVGYPGPGVEDRDYSAMCIANVLLGGNKSSLLFTKLREERGLGYQVGSQYPALQGTSHVVAYLGMDSARATPEAVKTVQDVMIEQVKALSSGNFTDEDLARAKRYLIGHHALNHERTRDRAYYIGWAEAIGLGYQADLSVIYDANVNKVTREDILRVCTRYLTEPTTLVYTGSR